MPFKRIQRKARPTDAYNDGSAVIPTGPERSRSIHTASNEHSVPQTGAAHERMRMVADNDRTVERCGSRTDATHRLMRMEREQLSPETVGRAGTVSLLRVRARSLPAKFESMWRCASNGRKISFDFKSPEGDGTDAEKIKVLRRNNRQHELRLDSLYASMDPPALTRWNKTNKRAGEKVSMREARDEAVWQELERLKNEVRYDVSAMNTQTNLDRAGGSTAGSNAKGNTARAVYSAKFYHDVARIQREMDKEDAGVVKPSHGDLLVASRPRADDRDDLDAFQSAEKLIEKRETKRRAARARKKQRKAELREHVVRIEHDRIVDPPSDNERS